jgi:hypothetical protein
MDPYIERLLGYLGDRAPLPVLERTPKRVEELVRELGQAGMKRSYAPEKWSGHQILCHLADVDLALGFRFRQILAEDHHRIQTFE